jgi:hypothetical protein
MSGQQAKVEVVKEDQDHINEFNRLNARMHDFRTMQKAIKVRCCLSVPSRAA